MLWIWKQNESLGNFLKKFNDPHILITYLPWVTYRLCLQHLLPRYRTCEQHDLKYRVTWPKTYCIFFKMPWRNELCHRMMIRPTDLILYKAQEAARPCRWRRQIWSQRTRPSALVLSLGLHFLMYEMRGWITVNDRKRYLKCTDLYFSSALYFFLSWRPDFWGIYYLSHLAGRHLWLPAVTRERASACLPIPCTWRRTSRSLMY